MSTRPRYSPWFGQRRRDDRRPYTYAGPSDAATPRLFKYAARVEMRIEEGRAADERWDRIRQEWAALWEKEPPIRYPEYITVPVEYAEFVETDLDGDPTP